jgi:hypothetical protein
VAAGEVEKVRGELDRYQEFAALAGQIAEVNEANCEARPVPPGFLHLTYGIVAAGREDDSSTSMASWASCCGAPDSRWTPGTAVRPGKAAQALPAVARPKFSCGSGCAAAIAANILRPGG